MCQCVYINSVSLIAPRVACYCSGLLRAGHVFSAVQRVRRCRPVVEWSVSVGELSDVIVLLTMSAAFAGLHVICGALAAVMQLIATVT